ncbi:unknown [Azospirillum sp. CAG:239]|nr:unknown [Azospirillum sp. CAG:239]
MFLFTLLQNLNIPILLIQVFLSLNILKDNEYTMMHRWLVLLMENMRTSL